MIMKIYQKPNILSESFQYIDAFGQYGFEITANGCPGLSANDVVSTENGIAFCVDAPASSGFTATITCQNISGTFTAVYGDLVLGGGLDCGSSFQSAIHPLLSVSPDLPENCIIESFLRNGSDQCLD